MEQLPLRKRCGRPPKSLKKPKPPSPITTSINSPTEPISLDYSTGENEESTEFDEALINTMTSRECRRSSRRKIIKFDVRDLLNKNRKGHKIQIEARIDSNVPAQTPIPIQSHSNTEIETPSSNNPTPQCLSNCIDLTEEPNIEVGEGLQQTSLLANLVQQNNAILSMQGLNSNLPMQKSNFALVSSKNAPNSPNIANAPMPRKRGRPPKNRSITANDLNIKPKNMSPQIGESINKYYENVGAKMQEQKAVTDDVATLTRHISKQIEIESEKQIAETSNNLVEEHSIDESYVNDIILEISSSDDDDGENSYRDHTNAADVVGNDSTVVGHDFAAVSFIHETSNSENTSDTAPEFIVAAVEEIELDSTSKSHDAHACKQQQDGGSTDIDNKPNELTVALNKGAAYETVQDNQKNTDVDKDMAAIEVIVETCQEPTPKIIEETNVSFISAEHKATKHHNESNELIEYITADDVVLGSSAKASLTKLSQLSDDILNTTTESEEIIEYVTTEEVVEEEIIEEDNYKMIVLNDVDTTNVQAMNDVNLETANTVEIDQRKRDVEKILTHNNERIKQKETVVVLPPKKQAYKYLEQNDIDLPLPNVDHIVDVATTTTATTVITSTTTNLKNVQEAGSSAKALENFQIHEDSTSSSSMERYNATAEMPQNKEIKRIKSRSRSRTQSPQVVGSSSIRRSKRCDPLDAKPQKTLEETFAEIAAESSKVIREIAANEDSMEKTNDEKFTATEQNKEQTENLLDGGLDFVTIIKEAETLQEDVTTTSAPIVRRRGRKPKNKAIVATSEVLAEVKQIQETAKDEKISKNVEGMVEELENIEKPIEEKVNKSNELTTLVEMKNLSGRYCCAPMELKITPQQPPKKRLSRLQSYSKINFLLATTIPPTSATSVAMKPIITPTSTPEPLKDDECVEKGANHEITKDVQNTQVANADVDENMTSMEPHMDLYTPVDDELQCSFNADVKKDTELPTTTTTTTTTPPPAAAAGATKSSKKRHRESSKKYKLLMSAADGQAIGGEKKKRSSKKLSGEKSRKRKSKSGGSSGDGDGGGGGGSEKKYLKDEEHSKSTKKKRQKRLKEAFEAALQFEEEQLLSKKHKTQTKSHLGDIERFIEDGVNLLKRASDNDDDENATEHQTDDVNVGYSHRPEHEHHREHHEHRQQHHHHHHHHNDDEVEEEQQKLDVEHYKERGLEMGMYANSLQMELNDNSTFEILNINYETPMDTPIATPTATPPPIYGSDNENDDENSTGKVRRSHRIKQITSKSSKLVGRGLVRDKERLSLHDDVVVKTPYTIDDQLIDLAEVEASNTKFLKNMEERLHNFQVIKENVYKCDRVISRETKNMLCECFLTVDEEERGEFGCGDECLNRLLMIECGTGCAVKDRCTNIRFQKLLYSPCRIFRTEKKGFGIMAASEIVVGEFIMEYVGEVIDGDQFERRRINYSKDKNRHYYFMALRSDAIIDATRKGNISRFINHSCDPNAETQKWTVNGELRIGFFSIKNIMPGEEITFDYQYQRYGREAQRCYCESEKCRGWIGEEPNSDEGEQIDDDMDGYNLGMNSEEDDDDEEDGDDEDDDDDNEYTDDSNLDADEIKKKLHKTLHDGKKRKASKGMELSDDNATKNKLEQMLDKIAEKVARRKKLNKEMKRDKKSKRKLSKSKMYLEDPDIDDEVNFLSRGGLKNQSDTLRFSRLMVRAKLVETRFNLLQILCDADMPCRRLFLDYHGIRLLQGWMNENGNDLRMRLALLKTLDALPIANKTVLKDSKVYQTIETWHTETNTEATATTADITEANVEDLAVIKTVEATADESQDAKTTEAVEVTVTATASPPSEDSSKESAVNQDEGGVKKKTQPEELADEANGNPLIMVAKLCEQLITNWDSLPEIFRIPKRERFEQMKEHEREADLHAATTGEHDIYDPNAMYLDRYRRDRFGRDVNPYAKPIGGIKDHRNLMMLDESTRHLSKDERRKIFAEKVALDEYNKRMTEERIEFDIKCRFFGLDPKITKPNEIPFCMNRSTGEWYSHNRELIKPPPSYKHLPPVKPKSRNPADYKLPAAVAKLPTEWRYSFSAAGHIYYYHVRDRIPQWEPPTAEQRFGSANKNMLAPSGGSEVQADASGSGETATTAVAIKVEDVVSSESPATDSADGIKPEVVAIDNANVAADEKKNVDETNNVEKEKKDAVLNDVHDDDGSIEEDKLASFTKEQLKAYVEEKIKARRMNRLTNLIDSRPISPRKEEDRIYNQNEMRKYKENKEKIRKRKDELRRRKAELNAAAALAAAITSAATVITETTPSVATASTATAAAASVEKQIAAINDEKAVLVTEATAEAIATTTNTSADTGEVTLEETTAATAASDETTITIENVDKREYDPLPIQDYLLSSEEEDVEQITNMEECMNTTLMDAIVRGDKIIVDETDALILNASRLKKSLPLPPMLLQHSDLNADTAVTILDNKTDTSELNASGASVHLDEATNRSSILEKQEQRRRRCDRKSKKSKDSESSKYRRAKEKFRCEIAGIIVNYLKPFRKDTCKIGRICSNDDFNHLARKLTHFVMIKELRYCNTIGQTLIVTESVKNKSREFIKKYMAKYGKIYIKPETDQEYKEIPYTL